MLVSLSNILDWVGDFKRPLTEGEEVFQAKMLIAVGRLNKGGEQGTELKVRALCLQTSALYANPHEIEISPDLSSIKERIKTIFCSCKAGTSEKCKHSVAALTYLNRIDDWIDLEEFSSTDIEQQWGKMKAEVKSSFEPVLISEYCHQRAASPVYSRGIPLVSDELSQEFVNFIIADEENSAIYLHKSDIRAAASLANQRQQEEINARKIHDAQTNTSQLLNKEPHPCMLRLKEKVASKVQSLSPELSQYYDKNVKVTNEKSLIIASGTVNQSEKLWFTERGVRIIGSKCYKLYTYCSNKKPDWEEKLKSVYKPPFTGNDATKHGIECESLAKTAFAEKHNVEVVENGLFVNPDLPFLGYSADGIVVNAERNPEHLLEIKCPIIGKTTPASELFKVAKCSGKSNKLKKKHEYYGQVQMGMLLLNLCTCKFILYSSFDKSFDSEEIHFDENFVEKMMFSLTDLYFDIILPCAVCK